MSTPQEETTTKETQDAGPMTQDPSSEPRAGGNKKSKKKLFLILFFLGLLTCAGIIGAFFLLSGSDDEEPEPEPTPVAQDCDYEGVTYEDGETFDAGDGCNSCICEDGVVACTEMACEEEDELTEDGTRDPDSKTYTLDLGSITFANLDGWSVTQNKTENTLKITHKCNSITLSEHAITPNTDFKNWINNNFNTIFSPADPSWPFDIENVLNEKQFIILNKEIYTTVSLAMGNSKNILVKDSDRVLFFEVYGYIPEGGELAMCENDTTDLDAVIQELLDSMTFN